jgi:hypothetical protein
VSSRVIPESMAARIVAMLSSSSRSPYTPDIPLQPRPIIETVGPVEPSWRVAIAVG